MLSLLLAAALLQPPATYPATKRGETIEDYHGTKVADPYRWLEDDNAADTKAWVEAQNEVTFAFLKSIPHREAIEARLTAMWNYERFTIPAKHGGKYFYSRNDGLQPQNVLYVADSLEAQPRVLLDPNTFTKDGTAALKSFDITDDGKQMAYSMADAGSDWETMRVRAVADAADGPDQVRWTKFSEPSWTKDGKGFLYARFDEPKEGAALSGVNQYQKLYYHAAGEPQEKDQLVYDRPDQPEWGFEGKVTHDGRYLIVNVWQGTDKKNRVFYRDLDAKRGDPARDARSVSAQLDSTIHGLQTGLADLEEQLKVAEEKSQGEKVLVLKPRLSELKEDLARLVKRRNALTFNVVELLNDFDAQYVFIDHNGPTFWFQTDLDAPRGRVIAIDTNHPDRSTWKTLIPQADATLTGVSVVGNHFICQYLKDAASLVKVYSLDGTFVRDVELPGLGTAAGFEGESDDPETFYSYTSYTTPPTIFRYDVSTGKSTVFRQAKVDFEGDQYETKQVFYKSKDGTRVPMFITARKGVKLDGTNPTLLYGYGGFNISITPGFTPAVAGWLEMGGVYAVATLRGGGEYGEDWHQGGMKLKKQNVFDDFIAAGEWLIANNYTSSKKLAIQGASNGGLLIGACMTQRPDLFAAALPAVGVMDMLRFQKFTIGWAWTSDYGSADDSPEMFAYLYNYSPYYALLRAKPQTRFPATMITTADHDDRVVPAHSFKFAAALQAAGSRDGAFDPANPLLIRIETRAGHGAGTPTAKKIEEAADAWSFLVKTLDFQPRLP